MTMAKQKVDIQAKIKKLKKQHEALATSDTQAPINKLNRNTTLLMSSYLKTQELCRLSTTCEKFKNDLQVSMNEKKKASELLDLVFNKPSCKTVQKWLAKNKPNTVKAFSLLRTNGKEEYFSKKQKKMIYKRTWQDISPLEAAAICGDIFLVRTLLVSIPENQKYEAGLQLQAARNRKEYLEPFYNLQKAYKEESEQSRKLKSEKKQKEREVLLLTVGLCQCLLPAYGLQEFFDDKIVTSIRELDFPNLDKEPKRSVGWNLDSLGVTNVLNLANKMHSKTDTVRNVIFTFDVFMCPYIDPVEFNIKHLCEKRTSELDIIIKSLLSPKSENDEMQISNNNSNSMNLKI